MPTFVRLRSEPAAANGSALLLTAFALLMFAANSLLCRMALGGVALDAATFATLRIVSAALMLWAITFARSRGQAVRLGGDNRSALYLFAYAVPFSFAYTGLTTGTGALILFGCVQLTMLIAAWRAGERPGAVQWGGTLLALGGLLYLLMPGIQAPPPLPAGLMAVAGTAWGLYSLRGRGAGDPLVRTTGNFTRIIPLVLGASILSRDPMVVTEKGVWLAVLSGAVASGLGYVAWYAALKHLTSTRAAVVQLLVPVLAAVSGVIVLGEPLATRLVVASLLVLGGIGLTLRGSRSTPDKGRL